MKATALMCTYGRHNFVERSVKMFLEQDYENKHLVIFQNSPIFQTMDQEYPDITLVNQSGFDTVGDIFEEAIKYLPSDTDLVFIWDDDDIYFRNHISNGVAGIVKYKKPAYKPKFALMRDKYEISKISNILEASWVLRKEILFNIGFSKHNFTDSHRTWVNYCIENNEVYEDESILTYCYTWNNPEGMVAHTSGIEYYKNSKQIHHRLSADHGDRVITPCSKEKLNELYAEFTEYINL
jgi:hypothetical protein